MVPVVGTVESVVTLPPPLSDSHARHCGGPAWYGTKYTRRCVAFRSWRTSGPGILFEQCMHSVEAQMSALTRLAESTSGGHLLHRSTRSRCDEQRNSSCPAQTVQDCRSHPWIQFDGTAHFQHAGAVNPVGRLLVVSSEWLWNDTVADRRSLVELTLYVACIYILPRRHLLLQLVNLELIKPKVVPAQT